MKRGLIISQIRAKARTGHAFTERGFGLPKEKIQPLISLLHRVGELKLVKPGRRGSKGYPAKYTAGPNLSKVNSKRPLIE